MPRRFNPSQIKSKLRHAESQIRREIDKYNREVRAHNTRVRANQRRLRAEIARLNNQRSSVHYTVTTASALSLHTVYRRVEDAADAALWDEPGQALVDLAQRSVRCPKLRAPHRLMLCR